MIRETLIVKFIIIYVFTDMSRARKIKVGNNFFFKKNFSYCHIDEFDECCWHESFAKRKYIGLSRKYKNLSQSKQIQILRFHETEKCEIIKSLRFIHCLTIIKNC